MFTTICAFDPIAASGYFALSTSAQIWLLAERLQAHKLTLALADRLRDLMGAQLESRLGRTSHQQLGAMRTFTRTMGRALALLTIVCSAAGCSAGQKRPVVATALDDREMRHESLEATLRVLDQHPEYVDEMFELSLRHPAMLDRLLHDTAKHLENEAFARRVAKHLADSPAGLRMTLVATLDEVEHRPDAAKAAAQAIAQRPDQTVNVMVQSDATVRSTVRALVQRVQRDEAARRSFLQAMDENRKGTAAVLVTDSEVLMNLFKEVGNVGVKRGKNELQAFLEAMGD